MSMRSLNRCDVAYGEHILVSGCEVVGIHGNPTGIVCQTGISHDLRRTMWWSCDENIILQLGTVIEENLILLNPGEFHLRQVFDPTTVQESLDLFANNTARCRNWMGLRCEEVNFSSLLCSSKVFLQ